PLRFHAGAPEYVGRGSPHEELSLTGGETVSWRASLPSGRMVKICVPGSWPDVAKAIRPVGPHAVSVPSARIRFSPEPSALMIHIPFVPSRAPQRANTSFVPSGAQLGFFTPTHSLL